VGLVTHVYILSTREAEIGMSYKFEINLGYILSSMDSSGYVVRFCFKKVCSGFKFIHKVVQCHQ
jgi:hypothetical protein